MPSTSEAQKRANQKWREANKEKYNAICAEAMKIRYLTNKSEISEYKKKWYQIKKLKIKDFQNECETFRNILN